QPEDRVVVGYEKVAVRTEGDTRGGARCGHVTHGYPRGVRQRYAPHRAGISTAAGSVEIPLVVAGQAFDRQRRRDQRREGRIARKARVVIVVGPCERPRQQRKTEENENFLCHLTPPLVSRMIVLGRTRIFTIPDRSEHGGAGHCSTRAAPPVS